MNSASPAAPPTAARPMVCLMIQSPILSANTRTQIVQYAGNARILACPNLGAPFTTPNGGYQDNYGYVLGYNYLGGHANTPWPLLPAAQPWFSPQKRTDSQHEPWPHFAPAYRSERLVPRLRRRHRAAWPQRPRPGQRRFQRPGHRLPLRHRAGRDGRQHWKPGWLRHLAAYQPNEGPPGLSAIRHRRLLGHVVTRPLTRLEPEQSSCPRQNEPSASPPTLQPLPAPATTANVVEPLPDINAARAPCSRKNSWNNASSGYFSSAGASSEL